MNPYLIAALVAAAFGYVAGTAAADSIAERAERAHEATVVATTEMAGKRYSVCLSGDQNLLPDWAKEPRIPLYDLDQSYR